MKPVGWWVPPCRPHFGQWAEDDARMEAKRVGGTAKAEPLYRLPLRLTDDQIGQLWFQAKIPGLTEADARRLIRAVEAHWSKE